jgi:hypothetical protein
MLGKLKCKAQGFQHTIRVGHSLTGNIQCSAMVY